MPDGLGCGGQEPCRPAEAWGPGPQITGHKAPARATDTSPDSNGSVPDGAGVGPLRLPGGGRAGPASLQQPCGPLEYICGAASSSTVSPKGQTPF